MGIPEDSGELELEVVWPGVLIVETVAVGAEMLMLMLMPILLDEELLPIGV